MPKRISQTTEKKGLSPVEVMQLVPGISRDVLHLWRKQGYIHPVLGGVGKRATYFYPEDEIPRIKQMWKLVQEGWAPRKAFKEVQHALVEPVPEKAKEHEDESRIKVYKMTTMAFTKLPKEVLAGFVEILLELTVSMMSCSTNAMLTPEFSKEDFHHAMVDLSARVHQRLFELEKQFPDLLQMEVVKIDTKTTQPSIPRFPTINQDTTRTRKM